MIGPGVYTAVVTPFNEEGEVDFACFEKLIERQASAGVDGVVILGTTGESPTLSAEESLQELEIAVRVAVGRMKVISGLGGNNTATVLETLERITSHVKLDGIMATVPYYNKPSQNGLFAHFSQIAQETDLPIMIYNTPDRTGVNILPQTLFDLHSAHPHICAVKEASGDYQQIADVARLFRGQNFEIFAGDDSMHLPVLALGGHGVVSVLSNALPEVIRDIAKGWLAGQKDEARDLFLQYLPLMRAIFIGGNPAGIKSLMTHIGLLEHIFRLPIFPQTDDQRAEMLAIFEDVHS